METGLEVCMEYLTKWLMISRAPVLATSAFPWDHALLYLPVCSLSERTLAWQVRGSEMWLHLKKKKSTQDACVESYINAEQIILDKYQ